MTNHNGNIKTVDYNSLIVGQTNNYPPLMPGILVVQNSAVIGKLPDPEIVSNLGKDYALEVVGTLKADQFEGHDLVTVPKGGIIMWCGSKDDIPTSWVLCDGKNGTPNLTDRFLVGAGNQYTVRQTGGEDQPRLTIDYMPSHNHGGGAHSHSIDDVIDERFPDPNGDLVFLQRFKESLTSESYTFVTNPKDLADEGEGSPYENRPPYYALAFIMKV